ncbi:unnamed protein product [Allacma fusca]|uniref:BEN domain-containing protein n=1 Tax=Allacma fusca TaxID=39272 RepID=A0A8J2JDP0_9HEXA|nr:unnamed protein product [Allacma fusca]
MSFSPFFLVFWKDEDRYSCVSRSNIVNFSLRKETDENLLTSKYVEINFNRKVYSGTLVYAGRTRQDVNAHSKVLENGNVQKNSNNEEEHHQPDFQNRRQTALGSQIDHILQSIENAESTSVNSSTTPDNNDEDGMSISVVETTSVSANAEKQYQQIEKLRRKLSKAKAKIKLLEESLDEERKLRDKYKHKSKNLQQKIQKFQEEKSTMIDIGNGVMLNAAVLERAALFSLSPSILGRNIFRLVFKDSEIAGTSLTGRSCNANKNLPAKPALDAVRLDAVINYCLSTLGESSKGSGLKFDRAAIRFKIVKSLGEYIREVSRKQNQMPGLTLRN